MRQPDDPEAIAERIRAFAEYIERVEVRLPHPKVRPLFRENPTEDDPERMRRILRGEEPGK